ncbi:unnamed protein product, partial [Vitis vinifera]
MKTKLEAISPTSTFTLYSRLVERLKLLRLPSKLPPITIEGLFFKAQKYIEEDLKSQQSHRKDHMEALLSTRPFNGSQLRHAVSLTNLSDEYALLALKAHITYDSQGILATNWSSTTSYCNWFGVSCNAHHGRLTALNLSNMGLEGTIPPQVSNLSFLASLDLSDNYFHASLPNEIGNCRQLRQLYFFNNELTGSIPQSLGNLSKLEESYLDSNHLTGDIPEEMSNLLSLKILSLFVNNLTGSIPSGIFNISLSKLEELYLGVNNLAGGIPRGMGNLLNLKMLSLLQVLSSLSKNKFTGSIPIEIGNLPMLEEIYLGRNSLTGTIPPSFGNLSALKVLDLQENNIQGNIPKELGCLLSLQNLSLISNDLRGIVPEAIFNISKLQSISLADNHLSGNLPSSIDLGNLRSLQHLGFGNNELTGMIPTTLGQLQKLQQLIISGNRIHGSIPNDLCHSENLGSLLLSSNELSGPVPSYIPSSVGQLQNLVELSLSKNNLQGPIPLKFGDVVSLESLDLSWNNLSGTIPQSLEALIYLKHLNVSFNKRQGEIRNGGPFVNFTAKSFISNEALYIPIQVDSSLPTTYRKISHQELLHATNYFSEGNLIGKGSMGTVYKGVLFDGLTAAIKVFNLEFLGSFKGFEAECEVMRNIRHRNLIKIISSCSNLGFKALVLEFMPNRSLERWLYSHNYCLDLIQRLNIMIDVASALEYLHHDYSNPVVHCDLKPNNVLLDEDRVAHVGDFGIAKLLPGSESRQQTKTLGPIGYMAPEYGSEGIVSTSDVYSNGIMLLEVFARKKPTDEMFVGDPTLKSWSPEDRINMRDVVARLKKIRIKLLM